MTFQLEPELKRYFDQLKNVQPRTHTGLKETAQQHQQQTHEPDLLKVEVASALSDDPMLAFMLRLDSILSVRGNLITCLATIRRNVHHQELLYLQRFKQIAEPAVRYPRVREQTLLYMDPKVLRCGQHVLLKIEKRLSVMEPPLLLRECAVLRATSGRDPAMFSRAYLFGCLGDEAWRVSSTDHQDPRHLLIHKSHFLLCQFTEDSLQRMVDSNRASGTGLLPGSTGRLGRDMLSRLRYLHSLGWAHNDLRPDCFRLTPGDGELLLADFAAATQIRHDVGDAPASISDSAGSDGEQGTIYRSARFQGVFADLESLVYILCALGSPTPLPWEVAAPDPAATVAMKLGVWQFAEEAVAADSSARPELWQSGRLNQLFNCRHGQEAAGLPAFRLAQAVSQLHSVWSAGASGQQQQLPDYTSLFDSLRDASGKTVE